MKMFTATRIAALAVGLSLAGGQAFADPSDGHGRRNNDNASDQQNSNDQNDRGTYRKKQAAPATTVNQNPVVVAPVQPTAQTDGRRQDRAPRQTNNKRGDSNDQNWRRDRRDSHPLARNDNRRGDWRNQGRWRGGCASRNIWRSR